MMKMGYEHLTGLAQEETKLPIDAALIRLFEARMDVQDRVGALSSRLRRVCTENAAGLKPEDNPVRPETDHVATKLVIEAEALGRIADRLFNLINTLDI